MDFDCRVSGMWYVQYLRERQDEEGWHFRATGNEERADEE
jgi:hypothetical protein